MLAGQVRDTIRSVLCKGLTLEQAEQITRLLVPVKASAGHPLMREGDSATGLFVLLKGTVASESLPAYKLIAAIAEVLAGRLTRLDQRVLELTALREAQAPVEELATFK